MLRFTLSLNHGEFELLEKWLDGKPQHYDAVAKWRVEEEHEEVYSRREVKSMGPPRLATWRSSHA